MLSRSGSLRGMVIGVSAVLVASWLLPAARLPEAASAQVPDAGRQRQEMIEELRNINKRLTEIGQQIKEAREDQGKPDKKNSGPPARDKP